MRAETVIATHGNTDFDALASQLAARRLYPGSVVALPGSLNRNVRDFVRLHADELELVEASRLELDAIRRLVVVETTQASRLGELEAVALGGSAEVVVFDHHGDDLPDWVDPETAVLSRDGALTTTLVGVLAERELAPTPLEATVFALGIHEDTGSLTYLTATQRDADALAWCMRHGASQELVLEFLHAPLSAAERGLLHALEEAVEAVDAGGEELLLAAAAWPEYVDGVSNLAHKLVDLTDCRALVVLVEMEERTVLVARSRSERIDAGALAAALGGGGHEGAASAVSRLALAEARDRVLAAVPGALREPRRARDVMSAPVRSVSPDETVARAMTICQRYGQSGIFVVDGEGRPVGVVRREDLDKAIGHELSHAPVKAVMSGRVTTAAEETTLAELQRLVTLADDGRVAIVREGVVVGVVSRRDLLRALGGRPGGPPEPAASLAEELRALVHLASVFDAVAALGDRAEGVYLVGGTVRDILLGERGFDVDIAVEGDAIAFARDLARALGGRVTPHEKFGTAVVSYGDGGRVDVVTTRTELYDAPASLPSVERAGLREDLFRRDFTINAMAASLKAADFGRLVDPFGGRRDLSEGVLRVLHNLSFIDDPTRIFRAVRYEARYGFRLDEHSARLARGCVEMGLVGDLSSARLRDELVALLEEHEAPHALVRLGELGAERAVHPGLRADEEAERLLGRALALRQELHLDVPVWRLGTAVLARDLEANEALDWLARLKVRRRDAERIAGAVAIAPRIVERLRADGLAPADVVALADPYAPDAPLLALALDATLEPLRDYFQRLRDVRLEVTGADLAGLGLGESPRVGEVLGELRRRKLNGELDGRESELAAARELVAGE
ncbi:MAG TPA: CBS domain-containing protein [Gaiellaceae bacterium]|nr:CBS domain-containing protein [Gaiellaceae bacterium]